MNKKENKRIRLKGKVKYYLITLKAIYTHNQRHTPILSPSYYSLMSPSFYCLVSTATHPPPFYILLLVCTFSSSKQWIITLMLSFDMLGMLQNVMNLAYGSAFVNKPAICPLVLQYLSSTYLSLCTSCTKVKFYSKSLLVPCNT